MTQALPDVDLSTDLNPYEQSDDPNRRTHIVNPPLNIHIWVEGMTMQEVVDIARFTGQEVVALCGYRWVPKHNPEKFDACKPCFEIAGKIMEGM